MYWNQIQVMTNVELFFTNHGHVHLVLLSSQNYSILKSFFHSINAMLGKMVEAPTTIFDDDDDDDDEMM